MRPLAVFILTGLCLAAAPHQASDQPVDKAKAAVTAFSKALKANDVDTALKEAGVPFLFPHPSAIVEKLEKLDRLAALLKVRVIEKKAMVHTAIGRVRTLAEFNKAADKNPPSHGLGQANPRRWWCRWLSRLH